jgi:hypothetical protein
MALKKNASAKQKSATKSRAGDAKKLRRRRAEKEALPKRIAAALAKLGDLAADLQLGGALGRPERKRVNQRLAYVPARIVRAVAAVAERNGGKIAGLTFDAETAKEALAWKKLGPKLAAEARRFVTRIESTMLRRLADVTAKAFAIYRVLGHVQGLSVRGARRDRAALDDAIGRGRATPKTKAGAKKAGAEARRKTRKPPLKSASKKSPSPSARSTPKKRTARRSGPRRRAE